MWGIVFFISYHYLNGKLSFILLLGGCCFSGGLANNWVIPQKLTLVTYMILINLRRSQNRRTRSPNHHCTEPSLKTVVTHSINIIKECPCTSVTYIRMFYPPISYVHIHPTGSLWDSCTSRPWFNIRISSYKYKKFHYWDKTVIGSHLNNGIVYTSKTAKFLLKGDPVDM